MKGRIKNIYKRIIKYPVTVWMVVSMLVLTAIYVAYAAYNGTVDVKRVVSTQATSTTVFSSNYLERYSSIEGIAIKNLRTTTDGDFVVSITVCNYDQMDFNSYAKGLIQYDFKAELVKQVNNKYVPVSSVQMKDQDRKTFYVKKIMDDNLVCNDDIPHSLNEEPFSYTYDGETLTGGNPFKDSFEICFDATEVALDVPQLFIRVTATPTEESQQLNSGISTLASIISISQGRSVETGWHGSLQETGNEDYDGYNLIIEGSGAGTIDILWDDSKFAMNPAFISLYGSGENCILGIAENVDDRPGWKKRTLTVNSIYDNRYAVQFYKKTLSATGAGKILCNNYVATAVEDTGNEP